MDFKQAVQTNFQKYATFSGRAVRSEYWYFFLFCFLAQLVLGFVDGIIFGAGPLQPITSLFCLATLVPSLAVGARRLHDVDRSGWWMLIALTIIGIIPLLIWFCTPGTAGDNRFGPARTA